MSTRTPHIIVVGSHAPGLFIKVKDIPKAGETVLGWDFNEPEDGGKGSNQAIAAARLGVKTSFVGCVGKDRIGEDGDCLMVKAGVDTQHLHKLENVSSGIGFIILNERGIPAMVTSLGANGYMTCKIVEDAIVENKNANVMLTQFEIPINVAIHAAKIARENGMVTIINPAPAPENLVEGLEYASILVPNESEAKSLLGLKPEENVDPVEMAVNLQNISKSDCVIITLGEDGVSGAEKSGKTWKINSPKVTAVDTSGAGDAFCAGLAVGLSEGKDIYEAAEWACIVAAISVSKSGTIPSYPSRDEVTKFINKSNVLLQDERRRR